MYVSDFFMVFWSENCPMVYHALDDLIDLLYDSEYNLCCQTFSYTKGVGLWGHSLWLRKSPEFSIADRSIDLSVADRERY